MKKFLVLASLLFPTVAFAQTGTQVYSRTRDATDPAKVANVNRPNADNVNPAGVYAIDEIGLEMCFDGANWDRMRCMSSGDAIAGTTQGLLVTGMTHFYNGATFQRWTGAALTDNFANPTAPSVGSFGMCLSGATWDRVICGTAGDAMSGTPQGIDSLNYTLFYDGANYRRWLGAATGDAVVATTVAPWTNGFNYWLHGASWDRMLGTTSADNLSATPDGLNTIGFTHWYDGTNFRRWTGATLNADALAAPGSPYVGAFGYAWDATSGHWDRVRADTNGALTVNQSTTFPGYSRDQDGDSTVLKDVLDSFADGLATTLNGAMSGSVMYLYNGATLDKAKADAVGGLMVGVDNWPGAFDEANARVNSYKVGSKPYNPPKETNAAIGTAVEVVLASKEIGGYPNCTITLRNTDAVDPFVSVDAYISPDNSGTCGDVNWVSLSWAACDGLIATNTCKLSITGNSDRYLCVTVGAADGNEVSVDAWLTCNVN